MKTTTTMTPKATAALKAAQNRHIWGRYATAGYCIKRGVPFKLYRLACQLQAGNK